MVTTSSAVRSGDHARIAACCAAAYVALCAVSRGRPPSAERQAFREVNRRQDRTWLRVPQQLGTPWALPSAAGALLLAGRRRGVGTAAGLSAAAGSLGPRIRAA